MKLESVNEMWESFARSVFAGLDIGDIQRQEMKRAFMAGCWGVLMVAMGVGEPDVDESGAVAHLEQMKADLEAFYRDVKGGRA